MEEQLYVHNAGLVILAPYFNRYFSMLDMLENGVFKNEEAAARAVLLLEYLASGRMEVDEYELAFNKILCGLSLTTAVPGGINLTEEETEVSHQLLNAVLQNWDQMSSSTAENLQTSFIMREGVLTEHEDHWALQVESKGFDVLLSFLPWTISVVNLSWIEKRLEVNWNTEV